MALTGAGRHLAVWQGRTAVRAAGLADAEGRFGTPQDLAPLPEAGPDLGVGLHDLELGLGQAALVSIVAADGTVAAAARPTLGGRFGSLETVAGPELRPPVGLPATGGLKGLTTGLARLDAAFAVGDPRTGNGRWLLGWAAGADAGAYVATRPVDP